MLQHTTPTRVSRTPFDAPVTGHDGIFWPVPRADMLSPEHIRDRMAQDIRASLKEQGIDAYVTEADLVRMGWRVGQINSHGSRALYQVETERAETNRSGAVL